MEKDIFLCKIWEMKHV